MLAYAHMMSPAKRDMLCRAARYIEGVRVWKPAFIPIRGTIKNDRSRARWKGYLVHIVISSEQAGEALDGRFHSQNLVNGGRNAGGLVANLLPFRRIVGEQPNSVADCINRGIQTRPHIIKNSGGKP